MTPTKEDLATLEAIRRNVHEYAEDLTAIAMRVRARELVMVATQLSAVDLGLAAYFVDIYGDGDRTEHHDPTQPKPRVVS